MITVNRARAIGEPKLAPHGFSVASACQPTPCPATPESLGVDSGADVQFNVPMMEDGNYALSSGEAMEWGDYEQRQISKKNPPASLYFKKQICP